MREAFIERAFKPDSLAIIERANIICADYRRQGFNLTLRQLYYQFVSKAWIPNNDRSYKRLGSVINDARLAGLMDWSYITDRGRPKYGNFDGFDSVGAYMAEEADGYSEAIWEEQAYRPEVWVEKEALLQVVAQACSADRVPYFACKGYVSQSAMYAAAKRFERRRDEGVEPVVIHLGDHDPSGIDMTRDIEERLALMSNGPVEVRRIALNMDQITQYNPPPNPTKQTDARAEGYIEEFGHECWELDALEPRILTALIQDAIDECVDRQLMDDALQHEQDGVESIREVAMHWEVLREHWTEVQDLLGLDDY